MLQAGHSWNGVFGRLCAHMVFSGRSVVRPVRDAAQRYFESVSDLAPSFPLLSLAFGLPPPVWASCLIIMQPWLLKGVARQPNITPPLLRLRLRLRKKQNPVELAFNGVFSAQDRNRTCTPCGTRT